jgi:hypothetical protein
LTNLVPDTAGTVDHVRDIDGHLGATTAQEVGKESSGERSCRNHSRHGEDRDLAWIPERARTIHGGSRIDTVSHQAAAAAESLLHLRPRGCGLQIVLDGRTRAKFAAATRGLFIGCFQQRHRVAAVRALVIRDGFIELLCQPTGFFPVGSLGPELGVALISDRLAEFFVLVIRFGNLPLVSELIHRLIRGAEQIITRRPFVVSFVYETCEDGRFRVASHRLAHLRDDV